MNHDASSDPNDDIAPEYDFTAAVQGKHHAASRRGTNVVRLDPDVAKAFPIGSELEVMVLDADSAGRRIRVSRKAIIQAAEQDELREYHERNQTSAQTSVGSLADKLRGALQGRTR